MNVVNVVNVAALSLYRVCHRNVCRGVGGNVHDVHDVHEVHAETCPVWLPLSAPPTLGAAPSGPRASRPRLDTDGLAGRPDGKPAALVPQPEE